MLMRHQGAGFIAVEWCWEVLRSGFMLLRWDLDAPGRFAAPPVPLQRPPVALQGPPLTFRTPAVSLPTPGCDSKLLRLHSKLRHCRCKLLRCHSKLPVKGERLTA